MRRCLAIASQTIIAAFRFRAVVTVVLLLLICVAGLPFIIRHNGTARMFAEVMLTYNLCIITGLLAFTTLWLACGSLAVEIASGQLQMVAIKPVTRWQIWLGKWLGILAINALLLGFAATAAILLLFWRSHELSPDEQKLLREQVLVARGSLSEAPVDLEAIVEQMYEQRRNDESVQNLDPEFVKQQLRLVARAQLETVAPNYERVWDLDLGERRFFLRDQPLFLRVKFHTANPIDTDLYNTVWVIGDVPSGQFVRLPRQMAAGSFQEFSIPPNLFSADGKLHIQCENRDTTTLLFSLEDGLELLYPDGGFMLNYARGVVIIFCWLALIAAMGLAASTFLSFPVATLLTASLLILGLSGGMFSEVIQDGTLFGLYDETGLPQSQALDWFFLPLFRAVSFLVNQITSFSPVESLVTGRSIGWAELGRAIFQIVILAGGFFAAGGIAIFKRRQLGQQTLNN